MRLWFSRLMKELGTDEGLKNTNLAMIMHLLRKVGFFVCLVNSWLFAFILHCNSAFYKNPN